ncbi:MAG: hypothetical protein CL851_04065 [Crocinitomicaceae bacterium]|nr:hypothetical protein [Crocinitomicaceae bacterium]
MLNLSILVCTKNSSQTILSCLNSALPIMEVGAELILVDGHSHDNTITLVLEFLKTHHIYHYKLISQLNDGLYEAFNLSILNANRNKLLFLHSDDVLKNSHTIMSDVQNSKADIVFYGIEIEGAYFRRKWHLKNFSSINIRSMNIPPHTGILVNRNVYSKVGIFSTEYKISADFEWMLRLLNTKNLSFDFSKDITYKMNAGGVSNSGYFSELTKFVEDIKVLKSLGIRLPFFKVVRKKINKLFQFERI